MAIASATTLTPFAPGAASSRRTAVRMTGSACDGDSWNHVRRDGLAAARLAPLPRTRPAQKEAATMAAVTTSARRRHRPAAAATQTSASTHRAARVPACDNAPATTPATSGIATSRAGAGMQSQCCAFQAGFSLGARIETPEFAESAIVLTREVFSSCSAGLQPCLRGRPEGLRYDIVRSRPEGLRYDLDSRVAQGFSPAPSRRRAISSIGGCGPRSPPASPSTAARPARRRASRRSRWR